MGKSEKTSMYNTTGTNTAATKRRSAERIPDGLPEEGEKVGTAERAMEKLPPIQVKALAVLS
jgi:hypothetical protein